MEFKRYINKVENKINGKVYVGQTIYPDYRPYEHFNVAPNDHFEKSIKKYGKDNFFVKILCEVYSEEDLDQAEQFYILEWYNSIDWRLGYNILGGGKSSRSPRNRRMKPRIFTKQWRERLSIATTKRQMGEKNSFYGKKHTKESLAIMKSKQKEMNGENNSFFGKTHTEENKKIFSNTVELSKIDLLNVEAYYKHDDIK